MPPVSSRTHRISKPFSLISARSGDAALNAGNNCAGRKLQNKPKCLRSGNNDARSGCSFGGKFSHLGPPTEPNKIASEFSHAVSVLSGNALPNSRTSLIYK